MTRARLPSRPRSLEFASPIAPVAATPQRAAAVVACAVFLACASPAPVIRPAPPPPKAAAPAQAAADDGATLDFRPQAEGRTLVEVVEPAGALCEVTDRKSVV